MDNKLLNIKSFKTIYSALLAKVKGMIVKSDWSQNDKSVDSYIKNRTHYTEIIDGIEVVHKLDKKYLPDSISENIQNVANKKMDKDNPTGTGSFSMNRLEGSFIGSYSHSEGVNTTASGDSSHAEGSWTTASGSDSHAEGNGAKASGDESHAEGYNTIASGVCSHAEGSRTMATCTDYEAQTIDSNIGDKGDCAHAEGYGTVAYGAMSHAEGNGTKASGNESHAEGYGTTASGRYSHAEGKSTMASGQASHSEGVNAIASGDYSHAESGGIASGDYSHAEGNDTRATSTDYDNSVGQDTTTTKGYCTHAEGAGTVAYGAMSHAEGNYTKASGIGAHAEGFKTIASGDYSHTSGKNTIANQDNQYVIGKYNNIIAPYSESTQQVNYKMIGTQNKAIYYADSYTFDSKTGVYTLLNSQSKYGVGTLGGNKYVIHGSSSGTTMYYTSNITLISGNYGVNTAVEYSFGINTWAFTVGNGTSDTARSNAHTLDWDGNAWYAGSVEGTALILSSPNGTRFNIAVGDDGVLSATEITEEGGN